MTKFPSQKILAEVRKKLDKGAASRPLPLDAAPSDKIKYKICEKFVIYKNKNQNLTQVKMAEMLGIDEGLMSKILHYHFDEFTTDRLINILGELYADVQIDIKTKKAKVA